MPNIIFNHVRLSQPSQFAMDCIMDFRKLLPIPDDIRPTKDHTSAYSFIEQYRDGKRQINEFKCPSKLLDKHKWQAMVQDFLFNMENFGFHTASEWCEAHWGAGGKLIGRDFEKSDDNTSIHFSTAWSSPEPFLTTLSKELPDIVFEVKWCLETEAEFEHYTLQNGVKTIITNHTTQHQMDNAFKADIYGNDIYGETPSIDETQLTINNFLGGHKVNNISDGCISSKSKETANLNQLY